MWRGLCGLVGLVLISGVVVAHERGHGPTRDSARAALRMTADDPRFFPLHAIRPGLVGVGRTVFQGDRVEDFGVEILGILPGTPNPKQSFIVARLTGSNVERTLVFAGMSGSPVFIEGKLVGAISAAFAFAKEPIALIMPIAHMIEVFAESDPAPLARRTGRFRLSRLTRQPWRTFRRCVMPGAKAEPSCRLPRHWRRPALLWMS
jgi:hypothetical protein